jgi:hypothetical protein
MSRKLPPLCRISLQKLTVCRWKKDLIRLQMVITELLQFNSALTKRPKHVMLICLEVQGDKKGAALYIQV